MKLPIDYALTTERLRLRRVARGDTPFIFSASRHPGFTDGMTWDPPEREEELLAFVERCERSWDEGAIFTFAIEARESDSFLGLVDIRREEEPDVWSVGYWIHPEQQRRGYATEAARAVLEFGFAALGARRVEAKYAVWNRASEKVLARLGMAFVRNLPQGRKKHGQWVEENLVAVDREAWGRGGSAGRNDGNLNGLPEGDER